MSASVPKILVVDDNHHIRAMLMKALVHYGYQVTVAADGFSGIEKLKKQKFDVVLLDLQLPDITGHGFLRATSGFQHRAPVIMISGEADQGDIIEAFHEHIADFVLKPFTVTEVVAALDKVLKRGAHATTAQTTTKTKESSKSIEGIDQIEAPQMDADCIIEYVRNGKIKLPTPNPFKDYISDMFERSDMETNSLVKLLQMDKDCASQIIHAALSKRHGGLHQALVDLPSAVKLLGSKKTLQILRVFIIKMTLLAPIDFLPEIFHRMWNNTMATASIARLLAENFLSEITPDRAYVLGFLHNIGELLVLYLATISVMKGEVLPDEALIAKCVQKTHTELGYQLFKEWEMSDEICSIVHCHHDEAIYSEAQENKHLKIICSLTQLAYQLAIERDGKYLPSHPTFPDKKLTMKTLGISEAYLTDLINTGAPVLAGR